MRFSLWALFALLFGAFIAHFVLADRGYVLINFRSYVIEMSVPGLVLVLLGAYLLVRALVAVVDAPRRFKSALAERRLLRSGGDLMAGVIQLVEGNAARSERLLTQGLRHGDAPLVNYLLAARAAQQQGASGRRDEWLKLAYDATPDGTNSVLLTQAQLQLEAGEHDAAVTTLQRLEERQAGQPAALALLARVHRARGDRAALVRLLPQLGRAHLPEAERDEIALFALREEFARADLTAKILAERWATLASELRTAPTLLAARALALQRLGLAADAEHELRAALKRNWHPALVRAFGELRGADPAKQLKQAETWLKTYPEDAVLLLTAARLCMANELWGKARSYLESSLALAPMPEAYALYGQLLTALGEADGALVAFRSGLALVSPAVAEPLPELLRSLAPPAPDGGTA